MCEVALADKDVAGQRWVCVHMQHMWDGVNLKYRGMPLHRRARLQKGNVRTEILVQRGLVVSATGEWTDENDTSILVCAEPWIAQPHMVGGTAAADLA